MRDMNALRRVRDYAAEKLTLRDNSTQWPSGIDRRESPRLQYVAEGTATLVNCIADPPKDIEPDFPIITLSLSRGGTGILANYEFQPGDEIELSLPTSEGGAKRLRVKVARCKRAGMSVYEIGCEFTTGEEPDD
jgi:PilZ domain